MRKLGMLLAFLFLGTGIWAQEKACPPRVVTVTGTSEIKVAPDQVLLQVGVENQSPRAKTAKAAADATSRKILAALKELGVEDKDVQTAYLSLQPQFDWSKGMRISYFTAEQSMTVKVRDISKIDDILDALIKAGGNRVDGIEYQSSEMRKYRDQAREAAVKAAQEKAGALAKALGQQIGKAYSVEEERAQVYPQFGYANTSFETATKAPRGPSTAPGQMNVTATVIVSFDLL